MKTLISSILAIVAVTLWVSCSGGDASSTGQDNVARACQLIRQFGHGDSTALAGLEELQGDATPLDSASRAALVDAVADAVAHRTGLQGPGRAAALNRAVGRAREAIDTCTTLGQVISLQ